MIKQDVHVVKGMQKDLSVSKASNEFVFDAYNIRITARENNTLLSVTNEKGNLEKSISLTKSGVIGNLIDEVSNGISSEYPVENDIDVLVKYISIYNNKKESKKVTIKKGTSFSPISTRGISIYEMVILSEDIDDKYIYYTKYDNTLLKLSNDSTIPGIYLGHAVINDYLVIFSKDDKYDYIHRFDFGDTIDWKVLYHGNLNFSETNPIETLVSYESGDIQKVYWVDGINQTRYINIVTPINIRKLWNDNSFNFVQSINLFEDITISKVNSASGLFAPGVIQYAFTYFNMYGNETNIFYTSELQYIAHTDRGASPDDKVSTAFKIDIVNPDRNFDYIRVYSIQRTSIDATPLVTKVVDLPVDRNNGLVDYTMSYVDNGIGGESVDPTELLYKGGQDAVFKTITQKDNTLFLGNIKLNNKLVSSDIKESLRDKHIMFEYKRTSNVSYPKGGYYDYKVNLLNNSSETTFKYLEWYRFGIQFQFSNGKWSEPIFIKDAYNHLAQLSNLVDSDNPSITNMLIKAYTNLDSDLILKLVNNGFVRARGVVVFPESYEREAVVQGILCPTVYNVGDRFDNAPFAQASWFSRPNAAFDYEKNKNNFKTIGESFIGRHSPAGMFRDDVYTIPASDYPPFGIKMNFIKYGSWAEFRHNKPIPNNWNRNAEIQCIANVPENLPWTNSTSENLVSEIKNNQEYFYIDQSIITLHSPDIEFGEYTKSLSNNNLKLRIVGIVPFTGNASDIDIQTSTPAESSLAKGFYKQFIGTENFSYHGYKSLISQAFWLDELNPGGEDLVKGFLVYPWHRSGSLNNFGIPEDNETRPAILKNKKLSNLKFSAFTKYIGNYWKAELNDDLHTGITKVEIFNSDSLDIIRLNGPKNSNIDHFNYYGNVDKLVISSRYDSEYKDLENKLSYNKLNGYPIVHTKYPHGIKYSEWNDYEVFSYDLGLVSSSESGAITYEVYGTEPVSIKYKSTPHAVFAFNYTTDGRQVILPTHKEYIDGEEVIVNDGNIYKDDKHFFWNKDATVGDGVYQDVIGQVSSDASSKYADNYGYLYIGELYNDNVPNRFGGTSEEALENNKWIPAGKPVSLIDGYDAYNNPIIKSGIKVEYTEGDTYYQRYDCLKTYPYTLDDLNSVVEIVSFMCETRVNIDGRYDRNRGQISNLYMTPNNFNKINNVYNQKNNFFNYRGINSNRFNLNLFPNTVTWTKEKSNASLIDAWTNVTIASTLDLDGSKGEVTSLNTFNDNIICFQDRGISNILFNSRVQIPVSDGVPIEITNGLKVEGKRYINEHIGCNNKWSIVESPNGIYFIDNITSSIYLFNGKLEPITDKGLSQWIGQYCYSEPWNPKDFCNFISFYDINNGDVYFTHNDSCLCFSETMNQFTSFMSYENVPSMFNIKDRFYSLKDGKLWEHSAGDYNMFYDEFKPYSMTFISNPDEPYDKIFDNIEFRADSWDNDTLMNFDTFDTLDVWNEYQNGHSELHINKNKPSTLKKKFRVWRANIPRDITNPRDRIRNTWAYIKLSKNTPNTYRTEFHDLIVKYFV